MTKSWNKVAAGTVVAALLVAGAAHAAIDTSAAAAFTDVGDALASAPAPGAGGALVVELAGTPSIDGLNDALNTRWMFDVKPGALVDAVSYQLTLATVGDSWLSEATVLITNSAGRGVALRPGYNREFDGSASFSGSASLVALNMAFNAGTDGHLNFQFYEDYDDMLGSVDAVFTAGRITIDGVAVTAVPEPASYGLMGLGLLGVAASLRRRRARR